MAVQQPEEFFEPRNNQLRCVGYRHIKEPRESRSLCDVKPLKTTGATRDYQSNCFISCSNSVTAL